MIQTDLPALCDTISGQLLGQNLRILVAIAGAPASGKSTQAALLSQQLNNRHAQQKTPISIVVPMDGYHLDNAVLEREDLLTRKGSPATFDATGLLHLIQRIRKMDVNEAEGVRAKVTATTTSSDSTDAAIAFPLFDRNLDLSRAGADQVLPEHRCIIVEGNYLLLEEHPWCLLRDLFDITVMLDVPEEILSERLTERWLSHGESLQMARSRAENNDLPNARTVIAQSSKADFVIRNG